MSRRIIPVLRLAVWLFCSWHLLGMPRVFGELARGFVFERGDFSYKIVLARDDWRTFYEAEQICQQEEDGHLVSIETRDENNWINDRIREAAQTTDKETFWVGANDMEKYGTYQWIDGRAHVFSEVMWEAGRPENKPQEYERCVTLRSSPTLATWVDVDCYEAFGYICKTEGLPSRIAGHVRWGYEFDYGDYIYKFVLMPYDMLTWPEAELYCAAVETGHLLSIRNATTEQRRIRQRLGQLRGVFGFTQLWIGANDLANEGKFVWSDKTLMGRPNWAPGQPTGRSNGQEKDCVAMVMHPSPGKWHDEYCLNQLPFICKIRMCNVRADIGFAVDGSGSVSQVGFTQAKLFLKSIVNKFEISERRTHVGVIRFSSHAKLIFNFNQHFTPDSLSHAIDKIEFTEGGTRTERALELARKKLFSRNGGARDLVPKFFILLTDGQSENPFTVAREARRLKAAGVYVIAVGIGDEVYREELVTIASSPRDVISVTSYRALLKRVAEIRDHICDGIISPIA